MSPAERVYSTLPTRDNESEYDGIAQLEFSAPPQRSLRLGGEVDQNVLSPQRRRGRREAAEKN